MSGYFKFLRGIYFFQELSDQEIRNILKYCQEESYEPGAAVFFENDSADRFYIVMSGEIEVWIGYNTDDSDLLAVHGPGYLFGEMALVDDMPRSATVISRTKTRLIYILKEHFRNILKDNSSLSFSIIRSLSAMVRKSNDTLLEDLRYKNQKLEETNKELRATQNELLRNERLSTLGKLSSMILHDIRNPISVLKGYTDLFLCDDNLADKTLGYARNMSFEIERLSRLANELLDYSRGEVRLDMGVVPLEDFLKKIKEYASRRFASKDISVTIETKYQKPVVFDYERMFRVFMNLAENARKAMRRAGEFSITAEKVSNALLFTVRDTGEGMDDVTKEHIFEAFYSSSSSGGTGLGMAIVKSIVEAHEGTIQVESKKGEGTAVYISLPLRG